MDEKVVDKMEGETPDENEHAIVVFVNGRYFHRGVKAKEETFEDVLDTHVFKGAVCKVRRGYGLTLKLRDFESARIDVGIEVPAYVEDADAADDFAADWCRRRIRDEVQKIRSSKPVSPQVLGIITAMKGKSGGDDDGGY